jgi:hypothetical protein
LVRRAVIGGYCSDTTGRTGMSLGRALVRLVSHRDTDAADDEGDGGIGSDSGVLLQQRAALVVEGLCQDVLWECELWLETWRGLSGLIETISSIGPPRCGTGKGAGAATRVVGMRTLRLMLSNMPPPQELSGVTRRLAWLEQMQDEVYGTLQVLVPQLVTRVTPPGGGISRGVGSSVPADDYLRVGVQLLAELLQQLQGRGEALLCLKSEFRCLAPSLNSLSGFSSGVGGGGFSAGDFELQAAGGEVLRLLQENRVITAT